MKVNYLRMIWDVNIYLAKIKDGKGKYLKFSTKKSLLTTIRPEIALPSALLCRWQGSFIFDYFSYLLLYQPLSQPISSGFNNHKIVTR